MEQSIRKSAYISLRISNARSAYIQTGGVLSIRCCYVKNLRFFFFAVATMPKPRYSKVELSCFC